MINDLRTITIKEYTTLSGYSLINFQLSYQVFGQELGTAPIVMVNHALTGNSNVSGEKGWWKDLIDQDKAIDTRKFTILSFNIPGNGYDGFIIENYKDFVARDIANMFLVGLQKLEVNRLFALVGGSLGGGIAWEMAAINPNITEHLIPIAADWKSTDWLIANCQVQEQFLVNSTNPVHDARMHAMLFYRTPESFKERFQRSKNKELEIFNVESWLLHHGKKLQERFQLPAYKLMNQLLKTIDATKGREDDFKALTAIQAKIHIVGVDSDLFFTAGENKDTQKQLALTHPYVTYHEINSIHGHDAFLIEYKQLEQIIRDIFDVVPMIENKVRQRSRLAVVTSARENSTNNLKSVVEKVAQGQDYQRELSVSKHEQTQVNPRVDVSLENTQEENAIHKEIFGPSKKIHLAIFGHGTVGSVLIDQMISSSKEIKKKKGICLTIFAIANSRKVLLNESGIGLEWRKEIQNKGISYTLDDIFEYANQHHLKNLIAVDNTASVHFVQHYEELIEKDFDLVSSNKIANTIGLNFYQHLRKKLAQKKKHYLYETNVGAGLPLIDTIKLLHLSGENITRIRGVFSGSLSYLFNRFSADESPFSEVLQEAIEKGYTEPDPREDLCGKDVARKLLILARELDLHNELKDVCIENLIPKHLQQIDCSQFLTSLKDMDAHYQQLKEQQQKEYVLRYLGDLSGDLSRVDGAKLTVQLVSVSKESPLGALQGSDSLFEIYTESYGKQPLVIQGAGAGAEVTARGVFGDILRLVETNLK